MGDHQHQEACTWERHVAAGETPPGQSFWGELNYLWCQKFCYEVDDDSTDKTIDVTYVLRKAQNPDGSITIG